MWAQVEESIGQAIVDGRRVQVSGWNRRHSCVAGSASPDRRSAGADQPASPGLITSDGLGHLHRYRPAANRSRSHRSLRPQKGPLCGPSAYPITQEPVA